jgi:Fe-S cluster assembly ATP-binding protein
MLEIKNLTVAIEGKKVVQGLNLSIEPGQVHVIMGPNGAGKSTLAKVLAGDPTYEVTEGEILFQGKPLLELSPEERSHLGLFMSFQYPPEIAGVSNFQFFFAMYNAHCKAQGKQPVSEEVFAEILQEKMKLVGAKAEFKDRCLNAGFSGGEKKRNEMVQMALLEPKLAVLDETDSGLDIDAMRAIAQGVNQLMDPSKALLIITHYQRLLDYIKPDVVHVMVDGNIVETGAADLVFELEEKGYDRWMPTV